MPRSITITHEIHSNTRRTRITYRGVIDGCEVAIKCYKRPAFGFFHWIQSERRGKRIRNTGAPLPAIVFSGWLAQERCFCFATRFLDGYQSLAEELASTPTDSIEHNRLVRALGALMAGLHQRGIEQPDGNLTNFMVNSQGDYAVVDEDDIRVHSRPLRENHTLDNLANVGARLAVSGDISEFWDAYIKALPPDATIPLRFPDFERRVAYWKQRFFTKKQKRQQRSTQATR